MDKKVYYFKPRIIGFIISTILILLLIILVIWEFLGIWSAISIMLLLLINCIYPEIMINFVRVPGLTINNDSIVIWDTLLGKIKYFFVEGEQMTFEIKNGSDYGSGYFLNYKGKKRKIRLTDNYKESLTVILFNINEAIKNHFQVNDQKEC